MQPAGKAPSPHGALAPTSGTFLTASAGSGVTFRAGAFVSLRVLADLGAGFYRVHVGERELKAQSSTILVVGALLKARVERAQGAQSSVSSGAGNLLLRILDSPEEKQAYLLSILGLKADSAGRAALAASLAEGLKPEGQRLARMRRAVAAGKEGDEEVRATLAARLESKGLGATPEALATLLALSRGEGGADSPSREGAREASDQTAALGREASEEGWDDDENEVLAALAALLQRLFTRNGPDSGLLGLFNHARGDRGEVLVPFLFELGGFEFRGSFRLHLAHIMGGPVAVEGRFRVANRGSSEEEVSSWGFVLESVGSGRSILKVAPPDPAKLGDLASFEASLAASGCVLKVDRGDPTVVSEVDAHA